jgi:UDP-2-acetamido-3-amino-2,3-dideoxy-glucuronate N-acetyltransferase
VSVGESGFFQRIQRIHETADVEPGAVVSRTAVIWRHAHVSGGVRIGENCVIGEGVHIGPYVQISSGCKIQNGAQLFEGVTLEDDVFVGPHVVFTNVRTPRAFINRRAEFKPTLVKHGASIGANATIICGVTIGEYAMVGAGAVVTHNVVPHSLVAGMPAEHIGWVCRCGRHLFTPCVCGARLKVTYTPMHPYGVNSVKVDDAAT